MSKGSARRPTQVSEAEFEKRWRETFSAVATSRTACDSCGSERIVTPEDRYGEYKCVDCGFTGTLPVPSSSAA